MFGWGFMWLGPLFLMIIAVLIYYLVISSRRGPHSHYRRKLYGDRRAVEILKERYAKGEISREEFFQIREEIYS
jgi:putative membrane protein